MADVTTDDLERGAATDEPRTEQGARRRLAPAAAGGPDERPALWAMAIGIAILAGVLIWFAARDDASTGADTAASEEQAATDVDSPADTGAPADTDAGTDGDVGLDIEELQILLDGSGLPGLVVSADGDTLVLTGEVPDESIRSVVIDVMSIQPGVTEVDATGLVVAGSGDTEPPAEPTAAVTVTAAQVSIVLEGTVPDEATRSELVARASAVYSEAQVDDRLVVDPSVTPPIAVTIGGAMTDPVLFDQVGAAFADIEGIEVDASGFALEESSDLESGLNSLEPIQFASASSTLEPTSDPILDQAAALLLANPDVALEIGGHTDSVGAGEANQLLSEARAQAVLDALVARGVENELSAVGFGEQRLKISPDDDDAAAQQANRRIEFRVIG